MGEGGAVSKGLWAATIIPVREWSGIPDRRATIVGSQQDLCAAIDSGKIGLPVHGSVSVVRDMRLEDIDGPQ